MFVDCILDLITNLLISCMVFVCDIQKPSIASHLKGQESSFQFCCPGSAFICILSLVMRKPDFCICENKDADQLRG